MTHKVIKEELIARARKPAEEAMVLHPFYHGKMQTVPRCIVRDFNDFEIWYFPGVVEPCGLSRLISTRSTTVGRQLKWDTSKALRTVH